MNRYTELEIIEEFASYKGAISSEQELSDLFDEQIAPLVLECYAADDTVAFNEAFNCWTDALTKDGLLHSEQYNQYCYIGAYS